MGTTLKFTKSVQAKLEFGANSYRMLLEPEVSGGLFFSSETGCCEGIGTFDFSVPHLESRVVTTLAGHPDRETLHPLVEALQKCRVYHFRDASETAGIKLPGQVNDNRFIRPDASNLAAFLRVIKLTQASRYERIRETIQLVAPFFDDFLLEPMAENPDLIRLEWRQRGLDYPFLAHHLSDGTLRFMALTTILLQPTPPSTMVVDEPELGLHPFALELLAALFHEASDHTQLLVSTQSPALLNHFDPEHVVVVERKDGASVFKRLDPATLEHWLDDYSLGELVQKNVIEAGPRHE